MSTRSPASSWVTACTREPRMPTQVPIGSMRLSLVCTAILARMPGSRAADLISSSLSSISGTSSSNSFMMNCGAVRDRMSCGPARLAVDLGHPGAHAVATRRFSFGIMCSRGSSASRRPDSMMALPRSMRFTVPVTSSSPRDRKSLQDLLALGVADALQDHLLRGLRADAAEFDVGDRLLDHVVDLGVGLAAVLGFLDRQHLRGVPVRGVVGQHAPAAEGLVGAGILVDRHPHVDVLGVLLLGRGSERHLERAEHDVARHVLLARQHVHQHDQFSLFIPASSKFRYQLGPVHVRQVQRYRLSVQLHLHLAAAIAAQNPYKLRRPVASGVRIRTSALCPAKRAKSAPLRSGRSRPGEDTSSRS